MLVFMYVLLTGNLSGELGELHLKMFVLLLERFYGRGQLLLASRVRRPVTASIVSDIFASRYRCWRMLVLADPDLVISCHLMWLVLFGK